MRRERERLMKSDVRRNLGLGARYSAEGLLSLVDLAPTNINATPDEEKPSFWLAANCAKQTIMRRSSGLRVGRVAVFTRLLALFPNTGRFSA